MPDHAWALVMLGLVAGMLSGMFGIGGGVVIVPALTVVFGYALQRAVGTSLTVLVLPVTLFAVLQYYRARMLTISAAAWVAGGLLVGGIVGAQVSLNLPASTLKQIYGVFLIWISWRFIEPRKVIAARANGASPASAPAAETDDPEVAWVVPLLIGLVAGIASGLFGIGGGLVIVPALITFAHFDQKRAVGTSLAALLPPVGLGAVLSYYDAGKIELPSVLFIAGGLVCGGFLGARIALGLPSATIKRLYGVFLIVVSVRFIFGV